MAEENGNTAGMEFMKDRIMALNTHIEQQALLLAQQQGTIKSLSETLRILIMQQHEATAKPKPAPRKRVRKPKVPQP